MKINKLLLIIALFVLVSSFVSAAYVTRTIPNRVDPGSTITVQLVMNNIEYTAGKEIAIGDVIPAGTVMSDWSITGTTQTKAQISTRFNATKLSWAFIPSGSSATVTYTLAMPQVQGTYTFGPMVWFDMTGMSPANTGINQVVVKYVICGDGTCEYTENYVNCLTDCPAPTTTTSTTVEVTTTTEAPLDEGMLYPPEPVEKKSNKTLIIVLLLLIVLVVVIYLAYKRKRKMEYHHFK